MSHRKIKSTRFWFACLLLTFRGISVHADVCDLEIAQFQKSGVSKGVSVPGKKVSCQLVDFGVALRSDFQPRTVGPLTDKVSAVRLANGTPVYAKALEAYYGARNLSLYANCGDLQKTSQDGNTCVPSSDHQKGLPLFTKLYTAIQKEYPSDPDLLQYITGDLWTKNSPLSTRVDEGSCLTWSASSLDPDVQAMIAKVGDGIFCSGMPFTKGELKEMITATYPDPSAYTETKNLDSKNIYQGANEKDQEQANLALARLGAFGNNGDLGPGQILQKALESKNHGDRLIMDLNPGNPEVWNQPIEAVLDVEYLDDAVDALGLQSYLTSADLGPSDSLLVNEIARAEADLKGFALAGLVERQSPSLAVLRLQMRSEGWNIPEPGRETLAQQITDLKTYQQGLISQHEIAPTQNQVTKHKIFIRYASEATFAQNHAEEIPSDVRVLDYVTVNGRSSWEPPVASLHATCDRFNATPGNERQNFDLGDRVDKVGFGLVERNVLSECSDYQNKPDHPIAVGAFPPKAIKIFHQDKADAANPKDLNARGLSEKQKLYNHLRDLILNCDRGAQGLPSFNAPAKFLGDFDNTIYQNNAISPADIVRLKREYQNALAFLDATRADTPNPHEPSFENDLYAHLHDVLQIPDAPSSGQSAPETDLSRVPGLQAFAQSLGLGPISDLSDPRDTILSK